MPRLMTPEIREYAVRCYVERSMSPTELVDEIASKFNVGLPRKSGHRLRPRM